LHQGVQKLVKDLSYLYRTTPALYRYDFDWRGFEWIDCNDSEQSVLSFLRKGNDNELIVVLLNLTPVPREEYRIGLPLEGSYREIINSDSSYYGGSNLGNGAEPIVSEPIPWMNKPYSMRLILPPLSAIVFEFIDGDNTLNS
jgi:1,4-alpha-glucan branching enzyme